MNDALDADRIHRSLSDESRQQLDRLEVLAEVLSTNTYLLEDATREAGRFEVVLAEHQTAGRGRAARLWHSPPGSGLCLSMSYGFAVTPPLLSTLTLVVGAAVADALTDLGARGLGLKWPNDIVTDAGKLGGILTDAVTGGDSGIAVIIGIGLNVDLTGTDLDQPLNVIPQPVADLRRCMDPPPRSVLAARVIESVQRAVLRFEDEGFEPFRKRWNRYDWLKGKQTVVEQPDVTLRGVADGIDAGGALRILTEYGRRRVFTGTVRVVELPVTHR